MHKIIEFERFSTYIKLKWTTGWVIRFWSLTFFKVEMLDSEYGLTASELETSENFLCRIVQKDIYAAEFKFAKNGNNLPRESELYELAPYVDEEELL